MLPFNTYHAVCSKVAEMSECMTSSTSMASLWILQNWSTQWLESGRWNVSAHWKMKHVEIACCGDIAETLSATMLIPS